MESTFLRHEPCPNCGSSDALAVFSDGHKYCYSCTTYFRPDGSLDKPRGVKMSASNMIPLEELQISALPARGITKDTCTKLKYFVGEYKGNPCQVACYYDDKGSLVGQKLRFPDKSFAVLGKISGCLYGSQLWSSGKKLVITEGEIDALSVSQMQGNKWPVVSIPNGAQAARKAIEANLEYLNNFEEIILMFDMDDPGRKACEDCAKILPVGKAYIANLPLKDPNECLKAGRSGDLVSAIWNAKPYRPDGIVSGQDLYEKCVEGLDSLKDSVAYPFQALQNKTNGARHGELYVITSGSGMGNPLYSESLNISLVSLKARLVAWLLLRNLQQRRDLNLCPYFLIDVSLSAWIPIVSLKKNSRVLLMPRLATESSSSMITLDHLILGICLVSLDT